LKHVALSLALTALGSTALGCAPDELLSKCTERSGVACNWAGTGREELNADGLDRNETSLYWVIDMEFAPDGTPWILDWNNHLVRRVNPDQTVETVIGTFIGDGPPDQGDLVPPGADPATVSLNHPTDLQFSPDGMLYLAAWHNHKIRTLDPDTDLVLVTCGRGAGFAGDGGPASSALLNQPKSVVLDPSGQLYILDQRNFRIRKISADLEPTIETVAGAGVAGFAGDGGPPSEAQLAFEAGGNPQPSGALALGPDGALYVADGLNQRIRKIDFTANIIATIAGTGVVGFSGDGGPAVSAEFHHVRDLEFGPDGRLYLADQGNDRIRVIDLQTGSIDTFVGSGIRGDANANGVAARDLELDQPMGIAFDGDGALYVADTYNSRILKIPR
jgi:DNA-binding beta-propeller fold protein YncE